MVTEKEQALRLVRLISALLATIAIVGSILLLVAFRDEKQPIGQLLLSLTAGAFFSGAVTALVFNSLSAREVERQVDVTLGRVLRQVFLPLRAIVDESALSGYRWSSHLIKADAKDGFPNYGIQLMNLSYTRATLPAEVSVVCIATMDDRAVEPFQDKDRYLMRWQIDSELDPADSRLFCPQMLRVDGEPVKPILRPQVVRGVSVCEYRYKIPRRLRGGGTNRVELSVLTRKYIEDAHVTLKVVLFSNVTDAEFLCTVDKAVDCVRLSVGSNATGLGPKGESSTGATYPGDHSIVAAHARYYYPLQRGTSITFYVDRTQPQDPAGRVG
jgi:hypothetical protein